MRWQRRRQFRPMEIDNPLDNYAAERSGESLSATEEKWPAVFFRQVIWLGLLVLFGYSFYLQVFQQLKYSRAAEENRIRRVVVKASRGIIKDRFGEVLARNRPNFELTFVPAYLPSNQSDREKLAKKIAAVGDYDLAEIKAELEKYPKSDQRIHRLREKLSLQTALRFKELEKELPGVNVTESARREYPEGEIFSHLIGYTGKISEEELKKFPDYLLIDRVGKNGLEKQYEKYLHGEHGEHRYEVNARGEIIGDLGITPPRPGQEMVLNIDAALQRKIYQEAEKLLAENKEATGVAVVAIDPRNGALRALVSYPGYDNNAFVEGIDREIYKNLVNNPAHPLLNRTISGLYPPGSTFKPLLAAAVLEEGIVRPQETVNCHGGIHIGGWSFPDWRAHGVTDLRKAIAESCDVYFYAVGGGWGNIKGLGIEKMKKYSNFFGLGSQTGIDLPGEKKGLVPDKNWKFKEFGEKWYIGDTYHNAIGQGYLLATPLQLAVATAAIANGGTVYQPRLVEKLIDPLNHQEIIIHKKIINQNFISPENLQVVKEGMRQTVTAGSGRLLNSLQVKTAGKTGTAQFGAEEKTHSWYISYAPIDKPELALAVLVESGGEGHSWAVPLTKTIYQWYFDEERGSNSENENK